MAQPTQSKATRRSFLKLAAAGAAGVGRGALHLPQCPGQADVHHVRARELLREELRRALPERDGAGLREGHRHQDRVPDPGRGRQRGAPAGLHGREQGRRRPGLGAAGVALSRRPGGRVRHRGGGGQAAGRLVRRDQAPVRGQGQVEVDPQREHRPADELPEGLVRRGRRQELPRDVGRVPGGRHQAQGQGPSVRHVHGPRLRRQLLLALPPAVVLRGDGHGQGRQEGGARHQRDRAGRRVRDRSCTSRPASRTASGGWIRPTTRPS